jgi:hypothetical protein
MANQLPPTVTRCDGESPITGRICPDRETCARRTQIAKDPPGTDFRSLLRPLTGECAHFIRDGDAR